MFKIGKRYASEQLQVQYINNKDAETIIDGNVKQEGPKARIFIEGKKENR